MLAARSRREAKQRLRRGAGAAVHPEQEATERVCRTRGAPGRRRSRAVVRPSTRASHPSRAGRGYSGFLPSTVRLSRLALAFDRREENHSHRQPAARRIPIARPPNGDIVAKDVPAKGHAMRRRAQQGTKGDEGDGSSSGALCAPTREPRPPPRCSKSTLRRSPRERLVHRSGRRNLPGTGWNGADRPRNPPDPQLHPTRDYSI